MPEVVFLPGFMQHADAWEPVAAAVGERYPVKVVDFETWTFEDRIAEIWAAAAPGSVLVGYSMGGRLALHEVLREPERYGGLVTIGASAGIEDSAERTARKDDDEELAQWIESHPIEDVVARWEDNVVFESQPPALVAAQRPGRLAHSPSDLARLLRSAGQGALPSLWNRLHRLPVPVLALAGENDGKYWAAAERIAATVVDGRALPIPDAGHAAHLEQPAITAALLVTWLSELLDQDLGDRGV